MMFPGAMKGLSKHAVCSAAAGFGILLALGLLLIPVAQAEKVMEVQHTVEFSPSDVTFDQIQGYDVVRFGSGDYAGEKGRPMLPASEIRIANRLPRSKTRMLAPREATVGFDFDT